MNTRTLDQLRHHYEIEKGIANRLKNASKEERKALYRTMYDELFREVPDHPRLTRRENTILTDKANTDKFKLIRKFIHPRKVFAEFAPGDCRFCFYVAPFFYEVYGIDISDQIGEKVEYPPNFQLIIYDGYKLSCANNSVDILFSDQLIEHIPADETALHFHLVYNLLKENGVYVFRIPHRFTGPHDISKHFTQTPQGFHLNEPTYTEILKLLTHSRFSSYRCYFYAKGIRLRLPRLYFTCMEAILGKLPYKFRRKIARYFVPRILMEVVK